MLGEYQVAMSIFSVLMTIVASGLPLVVSRTVAYKKSIGDNEGSYKAVSAGLIIALSISISLSLILAICPQILDLIFTQNNTTSIVLYALPGLIASAIYAILRSALWGDKKFFAISFTEFFEQVVRIVFCFILFSTTIIPISLGERASLSLSIACVLSCLLVVIIYFCSKQKLKSPKGAFKPLLKSSVPITTLRSVSSLVQSLIALIIPVRLMLYGYTSSEAMAEFGLIMGMAFPLIMIPGTLISSLAVTLVPEISSKTDNIDDESRTHDKEGLKRHILLGLNCSIIISMLFIPAFMVLGTPICEILFGSAKAGKYVSAAAIIMLPMGISQITSSILNSIGLELKSLINYAISAVLLFICIFFLPKYIGTYALIVGMGLMTTVSSVLCLRMLAKRGLLSKGYFKTLLSLLLYCIVSAVLGKLIFNLLILFLPKLIATGLVGVICVGLMLLMCVAFNTAGIKIFVIAKRKRGQKTQ